MYQGQKKNNIAPIEHHWSFFLLLLLEAGLARLDGVASWICSFFGVNFFLNVPFFLGVHCGSTGSSGRSSTGWLGWVSTVMESSLKGTRCTDKSGTGSFELAPDLTVNSMH
jgi:hypothetical protein